MYRRAAQRDLLVRVNHLLLVREPTVYDEVAGTSRHRLVIEPFRSRAGALSGCVFGRTSAQTLTPAAAGLMPLSGLIIRGNRGSATACGNKGKDQPF